MIRIRLPEAEADRLEQAFRQADDRKLRDRLQIILMAHRGRPHQEIATDLAISTRSVRRRLNADLDDGLDALRPREARGRVPKIPDWLGPELRRWVLDGPAALCLDRANWTYAELAVKGHRPRVGTRDCKDSLYVFAVIDLSTVAVHGNLVESPVRAGQATSKSETRRKLGPFVAHLRHVARFYPADRHRRGCRSSTTPPGIVAVRSTSPWPSTHICRSTGCRAAARTGTSSSGSGSCCAARRVMIASSRDRET